MENIVQVTSFDELIEKDAKTITIEDLFFINYSLYGYGLRLHILLGDNEEDWDEEGVDLDGEYYMRVANDIVKLHKSFYVYDWADFTMKEMKKDSGGICPNCHTLHFRPQINEGKRSYIKCYCECGTIDDMKVDL